MFQSIFSLITDVVKSSISDALEYGNDSIESIKVGHKEAESSAGNTPFSLNSGGEKTSKSNQVFPKTAAPIPAMESNNGEEGSKPNVTKGLVNVPGSKIGQSPISEKSILEETTTSIPAHSSRGSKIIPETRNGSFSPERQSQLDNNHKSIISLKGFDVTDRQTHPKNVKEKLLQSDNIPLTHNPGVLATHKNDSQKAVTTLGQSLISIPSRPGEKPQPEKVNEPPHGSLGSSNQKFTRRSKVMAGDTSRSEQSAINAEITKPSRQLFNDKITTKIPANPDHKTTLASVATNIAADQKRGVKTPVEPESLRKLSQVLSDSKCNSGQPVSGKQDNFKNMPILSGSKTGRSEKFPATYNSGQSFLKENAGTPTIESKTQKLTHSTYLPSERSGEKLTSLAPDNESQGNAAILNPPTSKTTVKTSGKPLKASRSGNATNFSSLKTEKIPGSQTETNTMVKEATPFNPASYTGEAAKSGLKAEAGNSNNPANPTSLKLENRENHHHHLSFHSRNDTTTLRPDSKGKMHPVTKESQNIDKLVNSEKSFLKSSLPKSTLPKNYPGNQEIPENEDVFPNTERMSARNYSKNAIPINSTSQEPQEELEKTQEYRQAIARQSPNEMANSTNNTGKQQSRNVQQNTEMEINHSVPEMKSAPQKPQVSEANERHGGKDRIGQNIPESVPANHLYRKQSEEGSERTSYMAGSTIRTDANRVGKKQKIQFSEKSDAGKIALTQTPQVAEITPAETSSFVIEAARVQSKESENNFYVAHNQSLIKAEETSGTSSADTDNTMSGYLSQSEETIAAATAAPFMAKRIVSGKPTRFSSAPVGTMVSRTKVSNKKQSGIPHYGEASHVIPPVDMILSPELQQSNMPQNAAEKLDNSTAVQWSREILEAIDRTYNSQSTQHKTFVDMTVKLGGRHAVSLRLNLRKKQISLKLQSTSTELTQSMKRNFGILTEELAWKGYQLQNMPEEAA